jgi:PAS domain S-box-containing protein
MDMNARFAAFLEAAPDAMVCVDASGRIIMLNSQVESMFGYQRIELLGQLVEILIPESSRAAHPHHRVRYVGDGRPKPMGAGKQLSGRRRDGSTFAVDISMAAVVADGQTLVTAAIRDVTSRQQMQCELERANRNLESFAYSVSHDLRAPLRALAGFSAALMEECADELGETGRGYAGRIQAASEQMARLIDELLALARMSQAEINLRTVDIGAVAASVARGLQRDAPERRVRFTIQQPVWVLADRSLIRTVLQNLLDNAWKFTSAETDASIEFGAETTAETLVCCYVRDNGVGFDPAYVDKLFQPFKRLHSAREFPGIGIGLASAQQILERHGGHAWAEGAVGDGATFYFTLQTAESH